LRRCPCRCSPTRLHGTKVPGRPAVRSLRIQPGGEARGRRPSRGLASSAQNPRVDIMQFRFSDLPSCLPLNPLRYPILPSRSSSSPQSGRAPRDAAPRSAADRSARVACASLASSGQSSDGRHPEGAVLSGAAWSRGRERRVALLGRPRREELLGRIERAGYGYKKESRCLNAGYPNAPTRGAGEGKFANSVGPRRCVLIKMHTAQDAVRGYAGIPWRQPVAPYIFRLISRRGGPAPREGHNIRSVAFGATFSSVPILL
jgi:hypothetical protein